VVQLLLAAGADIQATTNDGSTLLHTALRSSQEDVAQLLLAAGARIDTTDQAGNTPLHVAAATGMTGSVQQLLQMGADPRVLNIYDGIRCETRSP
jgi:ankyrin repeat protein